jgi:hypothetical protein
MEENITLYKIILKRSYYEGVIYKINGYNEKDVIDKLIVSEKFLKVLNIYFIHCNLFCVGGFCNYQSSKYETGVFKLCAECIEKKNKCFLCEELLCEELLSNQTQHFSSHKMNEVNEETLRKFNQFCIYH